MFRQIAGYTGFVPRSRELIALSYPTQSNKGLTMFSNDLKAQTVRSTQESPPPLSTRPKPPMDKTVIYPPNIGMIPHYTGYIPGW